ncbi:DUF302 domain-containing protein [Sulfurovum riftiae]|uniref:DUF302 domain-containing protein n=1 Tax=Sulfurovum riftiae TaxID=1630136 RepID=A0A151CD89_9BACT|nr:DUF302 domain-containing protein [Sulfurovum riftiae]KYJ85490.1 hypothetical protein AS592_04030 [Sulfurovum riftiae]
MKQIMKGLLLIAVILTGSTAASTADIQVFTADNSKGEITPATIEAAFKKAGFYISANRDMNGPFKKQFKESTFDVYNLFTFFSKEITLELVKKYPNIGLFAPMSMSIYTKKGEKTISVSSLTPEAMAKIMQIPVDNKALAKVGKMVKEALKLALPGGSFETLPYTVQKPTGPLVSSYHTELDEEDLNTAKEDFQMEFEGELASNGFVMAGFNALGDDFEKKNFNEYDFYDVYSICKLPVIYTVAKVHPEAGAFAPCSLIMYKKKNEKEMHLAFPSVYNWISSMDIKDKASLDVLLEAQKSMNKILLELTE